MPRQITAPNAVRQVLPKLEILSELLEEESGKPKHCTKVELEHLLEGHHHPKTGIWVDPYLRLAVYGAGEELMRQGDRDGNKLYIGVEGRLEVCVTDHTGAQTLFELHPGEPFGEMSLLSDAERNATISVPRDQREVVVLEIARPALEPLRKLSKFRDELDKKYRNRSFLYLIKQVQQVTKEEFSDAEFARLREATHVCVYGKHHTLCRKGEPVNSIILIKEGWVQRDFGPRSSSVAMTAIAPQGSASAEGPGEPAGDCDFLGAGNCLGLDWEHERSVWEYDVTVKARTETLEVELAKLSKERALLEKVLRTFDKFSSFDSKQDLARNRAFPRSHEDPALQKLAIKNEITTGVIDGRNLLVMDMDKCIRCGNCSLACHKVHGHSRLVRRGIHIERPVKPGSRHTQHVLTPQVCIQCQNPECLTDCPTGAVYRDRQGMIDINTEICIGCLGCANQCPYDAISMIPVINPAPGTAPAAGITGGPIGKTPAPAQATVATQTKAATDSELKKAKPPAPVPIVAVKCNLCENTPLNPQGKINRRQAYSCEENCPTGALVRVNPREYFSEIESTLGQRIFVDERRAVGHNIHRSDPLAAFSHLAGLLGTLLVLLGTLWLLARHAYDLDAQLGSGSWTMRWATGYAGLTGIVGVMLYPLRRKIYRRRAGALRYWLLAHAYLGVVAAILLLVHSGVSLGGWLTTSLALSFDAAILSGLFGVACYYIAPRIMTSIEEEPLLIEDLARRREELQEQLDQLLSAGEGDDRLRTLVEDRVRPRFLSAGFLLRQYVRRESLKTMLEGARAEFKSEFDGLTDKESRERLREAIETTATMRRVDALIYLHKLLRLWIPPHVISTALMLALMLLHIVQVYLFRLG